MKKIKLFFIWTIIPLVISFLCLLFIDRVYLSSSKNFKISKVEENNKTLKRNVSIDIPEQAKNIQVSYSGEYISYYYENKIVIVDAKEKKEKSVQFNNGEINYTSWLPDRNILFIGEKSEEGGGHYLTFYSYDSERSERFQLADNNGKKTIINLPSGSYNIDKMTLSTATNTIYVKLKNEVGRNRIYRINTMAELQRIRNIGNNVGEIAVMNSEDKLVYENKNNNNIYIEGNQNNISGKNGYTYSLLKIDDGDKIYLGRTNLNVSEKKIDQIVYWGLGEKTLNRRELSLNNSVEAQDIRIGTNGHVFIVENEDGKLKEVSSKQEFKYKGKFIDIFSNGIVSRNGNKILIKTVDFDKN